VCHSDSADGRGNLANPSGRGTGSRGGGRIDAIGEDVQVGALAAESVLASLAVAVGTVSTAATAISSLKNQSFTGVSRTVAMRVDDCQDQRADVRADDLSSVDARPTVV